MSPVVGLAEKSQVVLIDVLSDVQTVRLNDLLVLRQLVLRYKNSAHEQDSKRCFERIISQMLIMNII